MDEQRMAVTQKVGLGNSVVVFFVAIVVVIASSSLLTVSLTVPLSPLLRMSCCLCDFCSFGGVDHFMYRVASTHAR